MALRRPPDHAAETFAAAGLVCLGLGFTVDLGMAPLTLRVAMAYAGMRSASRLVRTTIHRESEVWCEPWAMAVLYALRDQHGGTFNVPDTVIGARLRVAAAHLGPDDRAALATLAALAPESAAEYPALRVALLIPAEAPPAQGKAWRAAQALVGAQPGLPADD